LRYPRGQFSGYVCAMPMVRTQGAIRNANRPLAGFSLVEILVVVMVILIIAAIAIPNLIHGKMRANEAAAVASVKTINTAQFMYHDAYPDVGFSASLANLGTHGSSCETPTSTNACLIMDEALTSGLKSGYIFEIVGDGNKPTLSYTVNASPESAVSGRCGISSGESGEVRLSVPGGPVVTGSKSEGSGGSGCE
jgi:type IV pilus assembly protein PilA